MLEIERSRREDREEKRREEKRREEKRREEKRRKETNMTATPVKTRFGTKGMRWIGRIGTPLANAL